MFSLLHLYLLLSQMLHVINAYEPGYQSVPNILEKFLNFSFLLTVSVWKLKSNLVKFSTYLILSSFSRTSIPKKSA